MKRFSIRSLATRVGVSLRSNQGLLLLLWFALSIIAASGAACRAESPSAITAIPVQFTRTVDAGKAKPGDLVTAKTMQVVFLPNGQRLPKNTKLVGHVVDSHAFLFDAAPYAVQKPSALSVHFDKIEEPGMSVPVSLSVRALANANESYAAAVPQGIDESDHLGTMVQIGGDSFSPIGKTVLSQDGDIVGYRRKQGIFARLLSSDYVGRNASFHCAATNSEQPVAIFSAGACGLYGFATVSMTDNGGDNGTFTLKSWRNTVKLYARSTALLMQAPSNSSQTSGDRREN